MSPCTACRPILALCVAFATFSVAASAVANVIPASRTVDWTGVGYPGGEVPRPTTQVDVTNFGAKGDGVTDDRPAIVAALAALAGKPGVVLLPAGKYLILSAIGLPSGAILRGAGAGSTSLLCNPANSGTGCLSASGATSGAWRGVSDGLTKGSTVLTLADVSGLSVGDWAELHETNGAWDTNPATWAAFAVGQMVQIASIDGSTITIDRPLRVDYDLALKPELIRVVPAKEVGIEDLTIERVSDPTPTAASYNIGFSLAVRSWVRGVESNKSIGAHVMLTRSARIQVTGSYFHDAFTYDGTGTRGYGVTISDHAGECLVEGNLFKHLRHAMQVKVGANGNVFAYNDSHDPNRSETFNDFAGDISVHGHYAFANLFEGNTVANIIIDQYWGQAGPYNTFFRNRAEWYGILITPDTNVTNNQNFVANEVVKGKSNIFLAAYYTLYYGILGTGHLQVANNIAGVIQPPNTGPVADVSYYRSPTADFCELAAAWPSIGVPNPLNSGANRARQRFTAGGVLTYDALWCAAGPGQSIVAGTNTALQGSSGGGRAPAAAAWSPTSGLTDANAEAPTATPTISTTYAYTRTDANGCSRAAATPITVTGTVAPIVFAPPAGTYSGVQNVTATTTTVDAVIHYTLDGSEPTESSPVAVGPIAIGGPLTLRARGFQVDFTPSDIAEAVYDVDVDECAIGDACDLSAACTNTWGGFSCSCFEGFTGDGLPGNCVDIDECALGSAGCDAHATCGNTPGSFTCACLSGFSGSGTSGDCADIDECALIQSMCDGNANCVNSVGGFTCSCVAGYAGSGGPGGCSNEDECALGTAVCDVNALCMDTQGAYVCQCKTGYDGNGMACSTVCGDGVAAGAEGCDDGNAVDDDACSGLCAPNPPGDGCAWAVAVAPGESKQLTLNGAHPSTVLPCDATESVGQADVFVATGVQTGWTYTAIVTPLVSAQLGLAVRSDCAGAACVAPSVVAPATAVEVAVTWTASQDGTVTLHIFLQQGAVGDVNVAVVAVPPIEIDSDADALTSADVDAGTAGDDADVSADDTTTETLGDDASTQLDAGPADIGLDDAVLAADGDADSGDASVAADANGDSDAPDGAAEDAPAVADALGADVGAVDTATTSPPDAIADGGLSADGTDGDVGASAAHVGSDSGCGAARGPQPVAAMTLLAWGLRLGFVLRRRRVATASVAGSLPATRGGETHMCSQSRVLVHAFRRNEHRT